MSRTRARDLCPIFWRVVSNWAARSHRQAAYFHFAGLDTMTFQPLSHRLPAAALLILLAGCASVPTTALMAASVPAAAATTTVAGAAPAAAASAPAAAGAASAAAGAASAAASAARPADPTAPKPFDEVIKGATQQAGFLPLWRKDEKLWIEIAPERMDQPFMLSVNISHSVGERRLYASQMGPSWLAMFRKIGANQVIIAVHIAMMGTGIIFYLILDKLETRDTHGIKSKVIGTSGIIYCYCFCSEVIEWLQPF